MQLEITENMLRGIDACDAALHLLHPFLPAQISTEPEANLELAKALIERYRTTIACNVIGCDECDRWLPYDLGWAIGRMGESTGSPLGRADHPAYKEMHDLGFITYMIRGLEKPAVKPEHMAQMIAFIARLHETATR